ncbi:helix-turn-helix domain-containing protein [Actinokineospora auranticolor]|uniref:TetR/AcrR family transcriptional regulator n=1 Tax=Actinokineospora auranticolor TaxID=155976 RepID=UPI000CEC0194|nr:TetR/AcrR family transcriptional regulator [Actinokineospora auranticolor]
MKQSPQRDADERILDRAAALFAQHGFAHTSLRDLADAAGLSKAGLLHHFPTKEALFDAAIAVGRDRSRELLDLVAHLPLGAERDRRAVELLTDLALERPGLVALASRSITALATADPAIPDHGDGYVFEMFGVAGETERLARVVGALGGLVVLCLLARHRDDRDAWRGHIVATCLGALGAP